MGWGVFLDDLNQPPASSTLGSSVKEAVININANQSLKPDNSFRSRSNSLDTRMLIPMTAKSSVPTPLPDDQIMDSLVNGMI